MRPTEPASISVIDVRVERRAGVARPLGFVWTLLASLGFACVAAVYATIERRFGTCLVAPACATVGIVAACIALEQHGPRAFRLVAHALALSPLWAATLFFTFFVPSFPQCMAFMVGSLTIGLVIVALPLAVVASVGAWRSLRHRRERLTRSWRFALAGIALLWVIPWPSVPIDVENAPFVQLALHLLS